MKRILAIVIIVLIMVSGREQENRKSKPVQVEPTIIVEIEPTVIPTILPTEKPIPYSCYEELHREIKMYMTTRENPEKMYSVGEKCTDDVILVERLKLSVMYGYDEILEKILARN